VCIKHGVSLKTGLYFERPKNL